MKITTGILPLLITCIFSLNSLAQKTVRGQVHSTQGQPITHATITLSDADSNHLAFTRSDEGGNFALALVNGSIHLQVYAMGFERQVRKITSGNDLQIYNFVLENEEFVLNEVNIEGRRAISKRNDTITFQVSAFRNKTENVLEDVLRKLPGITIEGNGRIMVHGKEIKRILVEGDDLVNEDYQLFSKNLSADLLEEIQIIDQYQDNPLLKGISPSDEVALNVNLKSDRKKLIFGDASADANLKGDHHILSNIFLFQGATKAYVVANRNNVGTTVYAGDIGEGRNSPGNPFDNIFFEPFTESVLQGSALQAPVLNRERAFANRSFLASANVLHSGVKHLTIKANISSFIDKNPYFTQSIVRYISPNDTTIVTEDNRQVSKPSTLKSGLSIRYLPDNDVVANLYFSSEIQKKNIQSDIRLNTLTIQQQVKDRLENFNLRIDWMKKINTRSFIKINFISASSEVPENLNLQWNQPYLPLPDSRGTTLEQSVDQGLHFLSGQGLYTFKHEKYGLWNLSFRYEKQENDFFSLLTIPETSPEDNLTNNFKIKNQKFVTDAMVDLPLGQFAFNGRLNATQNDRTRLTGLTLNDTHHNDLLLSSNLSLRWNPNANNRLSLTYNTDQSLLKPSEIYQTYIVSGFKTLSKYLNEVAVQTNKLVSLGYRYQNMDRLFNANVNLNVYQLNNPLSHNMEIEENYIHVLRFINARDNQGLSLNAGLDKYISNLSTTVRLRSTIRNDQYTDVVNTESREISSWGFSNQLSLISTFNSFYNYILLYRNYHYSNFIGTENSQAELSSTTSKMQLENFFKVNDKLIFKVNGELYYWHNKNIQKGPVAFLDLESYWQVLENKLSIRLQAKNILNQYSLDFSEVTAISESRQEIQLIPRIILVGAKYHF